MQCEAVSTFWDLEPNLQVNACLPLTQKCYHFRNKTKSILFSKRIENILLNGLHFFLTIEWNSFNCWKWNALILPKGGIYYFLPPAPAPPPPAPPRNWPWLGLSWLAWLSPPLNCPWFGFNWFAWLLTLAWLFAEPVFRSLIWEIETKKCSLLNGCKFHWNRFS